jgi:hypothetical protein
VPLLGVDGVNSLKKIAIHTDESTAGKALGLGLDVGLLANNHVFDCMKSGLERTISFLRGAGISTVGAGLSEQESKAPLVLDVLGVKTVCLSYVDDSTNPGFPPEGKKHVNRLDPERVRSEVLEWSAAGYTVLVNFHWGMDFVPLPSPEQRAFARKLVDAGASVVACYHPHRLLPFEKHGDGYIFYGLGNFLVGEVYPWPRFTEPTAAVTCDLEDGKVTGVRVQYFVVRHGIAASDSKNRGAGVHRKLNATISLPPEQYAGAWSGALAWEAGVVRPLHFIRRHKNPLKLSAALERRHALEYLRLIKSIFKRRPGGE